MKHLTLALLFGFGLCVVGCGSKASTTNVGENADAKALAEYEANMAAEQKALDEAGKATPAAK